MAINKILNRPQAPVSYQGEWSQFQFDTSVGGGPKFATRDASYPTRQTSVIVKIPLVGSVINAASGGVIAWQNPEPVAILVERVLLDITTKSTAASTIDVGYTGTSAATTSDTFFDGIDSGTGTGFYDSMNYALDSGANALAQKMAVGKWITLDEKSGDVTGLVGNLYIYYTPV